MALPGGRVTLPPPSADLTEPWALPSRMSYHVGIFLAVNAIRDGHVVIDGPDCNFRKAQWVHGKHDLHSTLLDASGNHRVINTLMDAELVVTHRGDALATRLEQLAEHTRDGIAFVCAMPHVMILGTQYDKILRELAEKLPFPVLELPSRSLEADWLDGYSAPLTAMAHNLDVRNASLRPKHVAVLGHLHLRNEEDGRADVQEIRRLLEGLGLTVTSVWLDGSRYRHLVDARDAAVLVALPLGRPAAEILARRTGQKVVEVPVPFGAGRTRRFLTDVAQATGTLDALDALVDRELRRVVPRLTWAPQAVFEDRRVAFSAPPMFWGGFLDLAVELGMEVVHLSANAGPATHTEDLESEFGPLPAVRLPYHFAAVTRELRALHQQRPIDLAIGDTRYCQHVSQVTTGMEFGFPSHFDHAFHPRPTLGFEGWTCFIDRMAHALLARR